MTLYLTDNLPPDEIARATRGRRASRVKLYPAGATTNSDAGVTDLRKTYATLEAMQREGMLLLVHGEVTDPRSTCSTARRCSSTSQLIPLRRDFPELKIVFEHITTREAAQYVRAAGPLHGGDASRRTTCSTTATRSSPAASGRTTTACRCSSAKRTALALVEAATAGSAKFFLGTDSAPHPAHLKEHASGCAGCYTAHAAIELYAEAFDACRRAGQARRLRQLPRRRFLRPAAQPGTVTLRRETWTLPESPAFRRGRAQAAGRRRNSALAACRRKGTRRDRPPAHCAPHRRRRHVHGGDCRCHRARQGAPRCEPRPPLLLQRRSSRSKNLGFLKDNGIRAMVNATSGKNCTDIALAIDAVDAVPGRPADGGRDRRFGFGLRAAGDPPARARLPRRRHRPGRQDRRRDAARVRRLRGSAAGAQGGVPTGAARVDAVRRQGSRRASGSSRGQPQGAGRGCPQPPRAGTRSPARGSRQDPRGASRSRHRQASRAERGGRGAAQGRASVQERVVEQALQEVSRRARSPARPAGRTASSTGALPRSEAAMKSGLVTEAAFLRVARRGANRLCLLLRRAAGAGHGGIARRHLGRCGRLGLALGARLLRARTCGRPPRPSGRSGRPASARRRQPRPWSHPCARRGSSSTSGRRRWNRR